MVYPAVGSIMKKILILLGFLITVTGSGACSSNRYSQVENDFVTGPSGPRKIYVPEYYVYRNGKYKFVRGHYRWVLSRRLYLKRSMEGYTSRREREPASIR